MSYCSSYGTPEGVSDLCYHYKAEVHGLVVDMTSSSPSVGGLLPSQVVGNTDKEDDLCSMNSMDPCTDLLDTLFTSLYTTRINASIFRTGSTPVIQLERGQNKNVRSALRISRTTDERASTGPKIGRAHV